MSVTINLNDKAAVRLTEVGKDKLRSIYRSILLNPEWEPRIDADGFYRDTLWSLMQDLGSCLGNGRPMPFESTAIVLTTLE